MNPRDEAAAAQGSHVSAGPTRAEHLAWCKDRALEVLAAGDLRGAFDSMASDLLKHPETCRHVGLELGLRLLIGGHLSSASQMRDFIEGIN